MLSWPPIVLVAALLTAACAGGAPDAGAMAGAGAGGVAARGGSGGAGGARGGPDGGGGAGGGSGGAGGAIGVFDAGRDGDGAEDSGAGPDGADAGGADRGADGAVDESTGSVDGGGAAKCGTPLPLRCGDRLNHSTVTHGRVDTWNTYNWTARLESGRETVYAFDAPSSCDVVANLTNLSKDLDLLLLTGCEPINANTAASSTPLDLQTIETVRWKSSPGQTHYVVVDGYDKAEGSYTLEVDCTCSEASRAR